MKKLLLLLSISLFVALSFGFSANGVEFKSEENFISTIPLLDDAYIAGGNVSIESDVNGDLFVVGGNVTINGNVSEDLVVAGGVVNVFGNVGDDLRVFGGQITVLGSIGDDLILGGGKVEIGKNAVINGSLISGAGFITLSGEVKEDMKGGVGILYFSGKVLKNVTLTVEEQLSVAETAYIGGDLSYSALSEMEIPANVVKGKTEFNQFERGNVLSELTFAYFLYKFISYLSILLIALLFVLVAPRMLIKVGQTTKEKLLKSFGVGILTLLGIVVLSIILMITIIGIPLALISLASLLIIFYVSKVVIAIFITSYFFNYSKMTKHVKAKVFGGVALGLLIYYVVSIIPFLGFIISLILCAVAVGGLVLTKFEYLQFLKGKKMV